METEPETIELQAQPSSVVVAADDNMIPFHILREATSDFSDGNLIGRGGFSLVYKGTLSDGTDIAVKRMGKDDPLIGIDTFKCEVSVTSSQSSGSTRVLYRRRRETTCLSVDASGPVEQTPISPEGSWIGTPRLE